MFKFVILQCMKRNLSKSWKLTWNINERNCNKKLCILTDIVWLIICVAVVLRWNSEEKSAPVQTKRLKLRWHIAKTCLADRPPECALLLMQFCISLQFSKSNLTFTLYSWYFCFEPKQKCIYWQGLKLMGQMKSLENMIGVSLSWLKVWDVAENQRAGKKPSRHCSAECTLVSNTVLHFL